MRDTELFDSNRPLNQSSFDFVLSSLVTIRPSLSFEHFDNSKNLTITKAAHVNFAFYLEYKTDDCCCCCLFCRLPFGARDLVLLCVCASGGDN